MQLRAREQGIAMLYALLLLVVVMGVATLMFARTLGEIKHSGDDAGIVQSLMLAQGTANLGGTILQQPVRNTLQTIVQSKSNTSSQWSFGTSSVNAAFPDPSTVMTALSSGSTSVAGALQPAINALICDKPITPSSGGSGQLEIFVTDHGCPTQPILLARRCPQASRCRLRISSRGSLATAATRTPSRPTRCRSCSIATGNVGGYTRNVVIQGEYDFTVGRPSFAKYALFTNVHELPNNGGNVWFTDNTLFDGPVHTNQYFRFYHKPWFGGEVTSAGCCEPGSDQLQRQPHQDRRRVLRRRLRERSRSDAVVLERLWHACPAAHGRRRLEQRLRAASRSSRTTRRAPPRTEGSTSEGT